MENKHLAASNGKVISMRNYRKNIQDFGSFKINKASFGEELENSGVEPMMIDRCLAVLKAIEIMMAEMPEQVLSGHLEGESKGYQSEAFNLIPHEENLGICHDITVAIARGSGVNKWGFINVMRQVRTHLITCPRTQVVIVLTDTWDPYRFRESRADLIAHMKNGTKIIIGLISKDQIRAMPLPF